MTEHIYEDNDTNANVHGQDEPKRVYVRFSSVDRSKASRLLDLVEGKITILRSPDPDDRRPLYVLNTAQLDVFRDISKENPVEFEVLIPPFKVRE